MFRVSAQSQVTQLISSVVGIMLFVSLGYSAAPDWVEKRPVDPQYYIGIGVVQKDGDSRDYIQRAKNAALSDLSSEIMVNISSEVIDIAVEQSGKSRESIRQEIRATTKSELEGYEVVDTYETRKEYWVYYRLSRGLWEMRKMERMENAMALSKDLLSHGGSLQAENNFTGAIRYYLQAFVPIQKYVAEPLETSINGENVFLKNRIYGELQETLSRISLVPVKDNINIKIGKNPGTQLLVSAIYTRDDNTEVPVMDLPVTFTFLRGNGEMLSRGLTNQKGTAAVRLTKITAPDKTQLVRAAVDIERLRPPDTTLTMVEGMIGGLAAPETRIMLNVSGLKAYIKSNELNFGQPLEVPYLEPLIKNSLAANGFTFSDSISVADYKIEVNARSRKGSVVYGQHVAYVDLTVAVLDMTSGEEIYKQVYEDVKGIHLDFERAGLKAFEKAGEKLEYEFTSDLLAKLLTEE
ncbi:MAG: LPP20 family lipoprotein [Candidatus Marinimicrobia bacterium]|nr:LPP20 family lipoprotein [Candidatus Neomarinimicrobiota bacterium]MCF7828861.1 LPP20 family lipoprotein [Candidatus Neomarinimicrobiota bacterium]MCF7880778.1 LPP20 family lipoprotein [Candidatus Neomarinimicrobiota bacterium]